MSDKTVTITPTEERVRLYVRDSHRQRNARATVTRWLERGACRKGRHINVPSVIVETNYEPVFRKTFLYASADSFPDTLPDWLRTAVPFVQYPEVSLGG